MHSPLNLIRHAAVMASTKTAALYYERIYPIPGRRQYVSEAQELMALPDGLVEPVVNMSVSDARTLVSSIIAASERLETRHATLSKPPTVIGRMSEWLQSRVVVRPPIDDHPRGEELIWSEIERAMYDAAVDCGLCADSELVLPEMPISTINNGLEVSSSVLVRLMNLNLVDTQGASWQQVLQFRSDPDAREAFARLRDFLFTSSSTVPPEALGDLLASIIDEYQRKSIEHGFRTRQAAMDVLLHSSGFLQFAGAGMLGLLVGQLSHSDVGSSSVSALAGTSVVIDCARTTIASYNRLRESKKVLRRHPANWVFLARNALEAAHTITM